MSILSELEKILDMVLKNLEGILILLVSVVAILLALHHIKEFLADHWVKRFRRKEFRLRTTIVKDMMGEEKTQTTKLRRLRAVKPLEELILDPWPHIVGEDNKERLAKLEGFYCVPGRLARHDYDDPLITKFRFIFDADEKLKSHREYSTLLAYVVNENIDTTLLPPYFGAIQPVGKESFTYEVHFPPNRHYVRDTANPENQEYPKLKVYKGDPPPKKGHPLRYEPNKLMGNLLRRFATKILNRFRARYHVTGGRSNFGDGHGEHDWFRVTVFRPPQNDEISICWCMEEDLITRLWCS